MKSQIMYIEAKRHDVTGLARIGRVTTSKSGKTLYYGGRSYGRLGGQGFKANYFRRSDRRRVLDFPLQV